MRRGDWTFRRRSCPHPAFRIRHYKSDDFYKGFINTFHFPDFVFVDHMAVVPEKRGAGIGSSIMQELLESSEKTGHPGSGTPGNLRGCPKNQFL